MTYFVSKYWQGKNFRSIPKYIKKFQYNSLNKKKYIYYYNFSFFQQKRGLDVNRYATKKTIAQGMLDVALLTANASQLKYVLQLGEERHEFYHLMLALIILSIVLQVC